MELFEAHGVVKRYAGHTALDKVSVKVPEASVFGLLGPNGAGKTSLIRIINQITAPDEGSLFFKGKPLSLDHIARIGYLPEERGLYKKMKVGEQALYLAQLKGISHHDAMVKLKYWFKKFDITAWWNKKVEELSKGMQQKVQFIITVIHEPELVIFDEPFSGFDPINVNLLKEEILDMKKKGTTIIFSTHNMASVEELCDHIALINQGKVILEGGVDEVRRKYTSRLYHIRIKAGINKIRSVISSSYVLDEEISERDGILDLRVRIPESLNNNDLVSELIKAGELVSFLELLPSMNDIFISAVQGKSNGVIQLN